MHKYNFFIWFLLTSCLLFSACGSPDLERTQERYKVTLRGQFLTEDPDVINFPIRVAIALDCSGSMMDSDPPGPSGYPSRIEAAREFIETYHEYESIEFDLILWNNDAVATGFTRDIDLLNDTLNGYANDSTTNYGDAIGQALDDFREEIIDMRGDESQYANVARMKCVVLFFSDGMPDPISNEIYLQIQNDTSGLSETLLDLGVASVNFHTFLLLNDRIPVGSSEYDDVTSLLRTMANLGHGIFVEFENADSINFINVVDMRLTPEYKVKFIVAYNMNVQPGRELIMVDSDADGLPDTEEDEDGNGVVTRQNGTTGPPVETDPTQRDSDGDGLSDYVERRLSTLADVFNPLDDSDSRCPEGAENLDRDRDGLYDCEEVIKGTVYYNPDTDADGIPDGIEFYMGANPLEAQYAADTDFDGVADWLEVQRHTNIGINDVKIRERYSYAYDIEDMGLIYLNQGTEHESRRREIAFKISNIDIMETLASDGREAGDNLIRLFIAEVPEDMPNAQPVYRVADIVVNVYSDASRVITIDSFEAL